jgi:hypothetical protein
LLGLTCSNRQEGPRAQRFKQGDTSNDTLPVNAHGSPSLCKVWFGRWLSH